MFGLIGAHAWFSILRRILNDVRSSRVRYRVAPYLLLDTGSFVSVEAGHVVIGSWAAPLHDPLLSGERVPVSDRLGMVLAPLEVKAGPRVLVYVIGPL